MALEPLPRHLTERTVRDLLARNVGERPQATALIAPSHPHGEARLSWGELDERSGRLAGELEAAEVHKGDRVAILLDQEGTLEAHVAYHAAHKLGAVNVPLNTRYVQRELEYVLGFSEPRAVVHSPRFGSLVRELAGSALAVDAGGGLGTRGEPLAEPKPLDERDDADWIFTSGTTGNPKAVALSHANSVACAHQSRRLWGLERDSVYQSFAPFFTSTGCHTNLLGALAAGCTYAVEPEFDCHATLERARRWQTTSIFLISGVIQLMFERMAEDELRAALDGLPSLRRVAYGGQPMTRPFYERVEDVFGRGGRSLELVHLWGLTEGGTAGLLVPPERHSAAVACAGEHGLAIGSEGFNEWVRWRVLREDDSDATFGEVGELCLRGPSVMERYVADEDATAEALRGGWLHTGDMSMADEEGLVYFVDRKKQMIRRGGLNISSAEVEGVVMQHPAVREVAVVPKPNPVLEQEVKAVVAVREGQEVSAEEIIAFCRERLADYKVPVEVAFMDALPRNAMNRVIKGALTGEHSALSA